MSATRTSSVMGPAIGIVLLLFIGLLALLPSGAAADSSSVFSEDGAGRFALFRAARALGLDVTAWTGAPGELPLGRALLFLPEAPPEPPGYPGPAGEGGPELSGRKRDLMHYRRFVERGGTLFAFAENDVLDFLRDDLELAELSALELREPLDEGSEDGQLEVLLRSGESFLLRWDPESCFDPGPDVETIVADRAGQTLCALVPVGRGSVCLLAPRDRLTRNRNVLREENGALVVRLLEELGGRGPILFDEYALGSWNAGTKLGLAFSGTRIPSSVHLVLFVLVALWMGAWVKRFPRDPEPLDQVAPLLRAQGFAALVRRAGRFDLLARMLRKATLRRLGRRIGLNARAVDQLEDTAGATENVLVERILRGFVRDAESQAEARDVLHDRKVRSEAALERLAQELDELELAIQSSHDGATEVSATPHRP